MRNDSNNHPVSTILIVDDDPRSRKLLATRLENEGYAVSVAADGQKALLLMEMERFDLVLLDLNMPQMNGYQVLEWLQKRPDLAQCVIVLTANGDRDAVTTCLTLGADDYLLKTAGTTEMIRRVERACVAARHAVRHHVTIDNRDIDWQSMKVLVVDDDHLNRKLLRKRLEHMGFKVSELDNGKTVMDILKQQTIDLVLLDHHMPDITGLDVLKHIREQQAPDQIGVMIVSAETEPQQVEQFYQAGTDDYLPKPFHAAELQLRLQAVLKNLMLQRQEQRSV